MPLTDISTDFSLNNKLFYLNHAAVSPWPVCTTNAIQRFADENCIWGATHYPRWLEVEQELRKNIQLLINSPSTNDIALVKNTSEALSFVAYGLDWEVGDNIVIASQEFPSNRIVWQSLASLGVEIKWVDLYHNLSKHNSPEDNLLSAINNKTRMLSVSSVQYADGFRMDLNKLGKFCQKHSILFCVDAIQSVGALKFDVQEINADFAMADGHKWLMSPEGLGFFYCRKTLRKKLRPSQFGWRMVENQFDFDSLSWSEAQTARKFECGSPNMLGIQALNCSIKLILEREISYIEQLIIKNVQYTAKKLKTIPDIIIQSNTNENRISGIIAFKHQHYSSEQLYNDLMAHNVICAMRHGNVRFSPHYYTSKAVIDKAFNLLKRLVNH
ncbi:MAG: aminotransferase class V-fold PLP-dependent enzyme [gamma proteobacterium symbiont of Bathyaustriella thionipta]|nr:aminotransferase class V-fold PLP-dependent enzyme [gamma proteobacterium symbiont of Bathyaustriella thionipta]MCU7949655.1 aminotransferase class V-fold PLP-dependent enzyme [gamma proteobacterium symbiont of Bathyaustriella thionipta]MCU7954391.1 aminotransferase class V-fold PLP-dependent enzyme [gamma proteobacterium symbiont of Bathyaustriella thionipta]MCU7956234.1 aminotransferase class V-fold PLP-dependent enzyme [gamma proteobacterium symbiont of Bathyaustriella thionipta]MCU796629